MMLQRNTSRLPEISRLGRRRCCTQLAYNRKLRIIRL
jgi:hypothetical protein